MSAGNVANRGNHDADREPVRDRDAEQADASSVCGVKILVRANRARADEGQRESANKFRKHFLRQTVQRSPLSGMSLRRIQKASNI